MESLAEAKARVIEEFSMYDEWLDKYEYLIELRMIFLASTA